MPKVSNPIFGGVNGGGFNNGPKQVTLRDPTTGSKIKYTIDGSNPVTSSTALTYSRPIQMNSNGRIKAVGERGGFQHSNIVHSNLFTFNCSNIVATGVTGGNFDSGPVVLTLSTITKGSTIHYTIDGSDPNTSSKAFVYSGPININQSGIIRAIVKKIGYNNSAEYTSRTYLFTCSDPTIDINGGTYTDGVIAVNINSQTPQGEILYTLDGSDPLNTINNAKSSSYPLRLYIYENSIISFVLKKSGYTNSNTITSNPFIFNCSPLSIDINGGSFNNGPQNVNISTPTSNCNIIYTLDGSDPETSSTAITYNGSSLNLNINSNLIIKAIATKSGYNETPLFTSNGFIFTCLDPLLSESSLIIYDGSDTVISVNNYDSSQILLYTTDGTNPLTSSSVIQYSNISPPSLNGSQTFSIVATKENYKSSNIVSITLTYICPDPISDHFSTVFNQDTIINISKAFSSMTMRYTLDGSNPLISPTAILTTENSVSIDLTQPVILSIICTQNNYENSNEVYYNYGFSCLPPSIPSYNSSTLINDILVTIVPYDQNDTIMYSIDGARTFDVYSSPITLSGNVNLLIFSKRQRWNSSRTVSYVFTFACSNINMGGALFGTNYYEPKTITLSSLTLSSEILYTIDDTDPLVSNTAILYTSPILIKHSIYLRANTKKTNYNNSGEISGSINVLPEDPAIYPTSQIFYGDITIEVEPLNNDENFVVYTTDGSTPNINSKRYSSSLEFYESLTINFLSINSITQSKSSVVSGIYSKFGDAFPGESGPQTILATEVLPNNTPEDQLKLLPQDVCVVMSGNDLNGLLKTNVTLNEVSVLTMGLFIPGTQAPKLARVDINIDNVSAAIENINTSIPI